MLTIKRLSIAALAFGMTLAAETGFAGGCRGGAGIAPSYASHAYRPGYAVQPCHQQPIYYAPSYQYPAYVGTPVAPVTPFKAAPVAVPVAPFKAAAPVAVNLPPAGPLSAAPVAGKVVATFAPGTSAAATVIPVSNSNVPSPGPLASAPLGAAQVAPTGIAAPVAIPQTTPLTLPANPQAPRIETPATVPGPVGALTAYNVGVQGPVANVQPGAEQVALRAPKFEE